MTTHGYDAFYREFDSPLMQRIRAEAYGEDIGQHSWVTADELRADVRRLGLSAVSRFIDLGCGPAGPLTFVVRTVGCHGSGVDVSPAAVSAGRRRTQSLGVDAHVSLSEADLDATLPFDSASFDAAMALDVVLHLRDRASFYREVARILRPGGPFLVTDAGIVTGAISGDEITRRSPYMHTSFTVCGSNESLLEAAGFHVVEIEDRTVSTLRNAAGRLRSIRAHRHELVATSGPNAIAGQEVYLGTVVSLADRGALARVMYFAVRH